LGTRLPRRRRGEQILVEKVATEDRLHAEHGEHGGTYSDSQQRDQIGRRSQRGLIQPRLGLDALEQIGASQVEHFALRKAGMVLDLSQRDANQSEPVRVAVVERPDENLVDHR
jgi:hypothetical protein